MALSVAAGLQTGKGWLVNMAKVLVVVDMQNDFISGSLGTKEAQAIVPAVVEKIRKYPGQRRCGLVYIRYAWRGLSGDAGGT